jgi:hypothetical protein
LSAGRPCAAPARLTSWPFETAIPPTTIWSMTGIGSSTTTVWVFEVQPMALHAVSVTCLVPGVAKVAAGFSAVEVLGGRAAADGAKANPPRRQRTSARAMERIPGDGATQAAAGPTHRRTCGNAS